MKLNEINIRDPFVLPYNGKYYMYGSRVAVQTGFDVYISEDLVEWSEPKSLFEKNDDFWGICDFWAPEVHIYNGKFYMFASFKAPNAQRGTAILVCDTPDGEFKVHNRRVTPEEWECLDGTLYVEDGVPYMVFCHEWIQVHNGEVCAVKMSKDLKETIGEPRLLWKAADAKWISAVGDKDSGNYVTDGPFLYKTHNGGLRSLWSSFSNGEYVLATATSANGSINGEWKIDDDLIYEKDGGHGMIFETFDGDKMIAMHIPNRHLDERPVFMKMQ